MKVFDLNHISCIYIHLGTMVIQNPGNNLIIMINSDKNNSRLLSFV